MGLDKRHQKPSADENSTGDMKVEVIEEAVFQGACDISMVKQELRYLQLTLLIFPSRLIPNVF